MVIGCSISGLCMAKALSLTYTEIIILEKEQRLRLNPHAHILFQPHLLEELFPGFQEAILKNGAKKVSVTYQYEGDAREHEELVVDERYILDKTLLQMLPKHVEIKKSSGVFGLMFRKPGEVCGVRLMDSSIILADLVVDCSGYHTKIDKWMPVPPKVIQSHLTVNFQSSSRDEDAKYHVVPGKSVAIGKTQTVFNDDARNFVSMFWRYPPEGMTGFLVIGDAQCTLSPKFSLGVTLAVKSALIIQGGGGQRDVCNMTWPYYKFTTRIGDSVFRYPWLYERRVIFLCCC